MNEETVHFYRKFAVERLEYACRGNPGKNSPRHLEIKENRRSAGYSSCADLAHWLYFQLGIRLDFINRREHQGWVTGVNVWRLVTQAKPYVGAKLEGGDVIIVANEWPSGLDSHVICIIDEPRLDGLAPCFDTAESGLPGNGLMRRWLPLRRKIRVVLSLADILERAEREGKLLEVT